MSRARWVLAGVWAVQILVQAYFILALPQGRQMATVDDILSIPAPLFAAGAAAVAARAARGRTRAGWTLLGLSAAAFALGSVIWLILEVGLSQEPFPSAADAAFLASMPLAALGVLVMPGAAARGMSRLVAVLDGSVVAAALLTMSWALFMRQIQTEATPWANAIALAYPVGDVFVLTALVSVMLRVRARRLLPLALLAVGLAANALADTLFAYFAAAGGYGSGQLLDVAWVAGYVLIGYSALTARGAVWEQRAEADRPPFLGSLLVYGLVLLTILAVAYEFRRRGGMDAPTFVGSVATVCGLLGRQLVLILDLERLGRRQREVEAQLSASEGRMRQVLANAPVNVFTVDPDWRLTIFQGLPQDLPTAAGAGPHQALAGRDAREVLPDAPDALEAIARALRGQPATARMVRRGRTIELRCPPMPAPDGRVWVSGVGIDVTQEVLAEQARRESEAKTRFLANMSHELRTPLNSVLGFTQLLAMEAAGPITARQRHYLDNIQVSGEQLLALITEVLDLTRVAQGRLRLTTRDFALGPVLAGAVESVRVLADRDGIALTLSCPETLSVRADRRRVEQVVLNLLANAVKFTPPGGSISVEATGDREKVAIAVTDTGPGIAAADQERIFEEFTQVEPGHLRPGVGTGAGLGLSLSRQLARLMGGDVSVRSRLGEGAAFTVSLPASAGAGQPLDEVAEPAQPLP